MQPDIYLEYTISGYQITGIVVPDLFAICEPNDIPPSKAQALPKATIQKRGKNTLTFAFLAFSSDGRVWACTGRGRMRNVKKRHDKGKFITN